MILEKDQIHRYMRHIIMPEISGPGQKRLLDSSVLILCDDLQQSAFMLYYLTAMGIGNITCKFKGASDSQHLLDNLNGLNPDVHIKFENTSSTDSSYDSVIIFNVSKKIEEHIDALNNVPLIFASMYDGKGFLKTSVAQTSLTAALNEYVEFNKHQDKMSCQTLLDFSCNCLVGALAAVEAVKALLKIGCWCEEPLFIDLWSYSFTHDYHEIPASTGSVSIEAFSTKLKDAKVLIVGSGGLGSPVAYILAKMGVGKLGLVDFDTVDISNLNRQILHSTNRIGMPKVESAKAFLSELNPDIEIAVYQEKFSVENAEALVQQYDIIVDGLDNLPTRYLLNDTCYFLKKPLIEAGVLTFNGLATAIIPDQGPCYRCTFPEVEDTSAIPSCSETGVLGVVPGIMGALQAAEVLKQLTDSGETLLNRIVMFDALNTEFTKLDIYKEETCPLCGSNPTIDALKDYNFVCSSKK